MKSAYYTAVVTNAYRMAIDSYLADPEGYSFDPAWKRELEGVSHRAYHTGFYFDEPTEVANTTDFNGYIKENAYLATVVSYDEESGLARLIQKNKFSVGARVDLLTPGRVGTPLVVEALYDADMRQIESVPHPQMPFYMKMPFAVKPGDILRAAT